MQIRLINRQFLWFAIGYFYLWLGCPVPLGIHFEWPITLEVIAFFPLFDHSYFQIYFWGSLQQEPISSIDLFTFSYIESNPLNILIYYGLFYIIPGFIIGSYGCCAFIPIEKTRTPRLIAIGFQILQFIGLFLIYLFWFLPIINALAKSFPPIEFIITYPGLFGSGANILIVLFCLQFFFFRSSESFVASPLPESSHLQQRYRQPDWILIGFGLIFVVLIHSVFSFPVYYLQKDNINLFFWGSTINREEGNIVSVDLTKNGFAFYPFLLFFSLAFLLGVICLVLGMGKIRYVRIKKLMKINLCLGLFLILYILINFIILNFQGPASLGLPIFLYCGFEAFSLYKYNLLFHKKS